jgi:hypothetical protein
MASIMASIMTSMISASVDRWGAIRWVQSTRLNESKGTDEGVLLGRVRLL